MAPPFEEQDQAARILPVSAPSPQLFFRKFVVRGPLFSPLFTLRETPGMVSSPHSEGIMKTTLAVFFVLFIFPPFSAAQIQGEVSCDKGVKMPSVQALVKRTAEALKEDQATVVKEINSGDKKWKDGDLYVVVFQGTKALAHGYMPQFAGQDFGSTTYQNSYPWIRSAARIAAAKGEGCIQYRFHNPAKGGQVEEKVTYVVKVSDSIWTASGTYLVRK